MASIIEFLEDRIAEDESSASNFHETYCGWSLHEGAGFSEDGCECNYPSRILAECAAKRAIIAQARNANDVEQEFDERLWHGAGPERTEPWTGDAIIHALAAVYKDHPDYQQEWARG